MCVEDFLTNLVKLTEMLSALYVIESSLLHAKLQGYQNDHPLGAARKCRRTTEMAIKPNSTDITLKGYVMI